MDELKDFDPGEFLRDPPMRPGSTQIEQGAGNDPALMIQDMKTAAREAAKPPKVDRVDPGMYEGAGGYGYEVSPRGEVTIIKAPKGRGVGTMLSRGMAYRAIMDELKNLTPGMSDLAEGGLTMDTRRTESADFDAMPGIDTSDGGVVSGEGRSGQEMARVQGMSNEEQVAELDRGRKVEMSPAARLAFLRTKAKNRG